MQKIKKKLVEQLSELQDTLFVGSANGIKLYCESACVLKLS